MAGYRVTIDRRRMQRLAKDKSSQAVRKGAQTVEFRAKANLARAGRVRTGELIQSIKITERPWRGDTITFKVGSDLHYAIYQEKGVGPFGPVSAKFLRFIPKGGTDYVFAKRVRGFDGAHYLEDALKSLRTSDFTDGIQ